MANFPSWSRMPNKHPVQRGNQSEFQVTCIQTAPIIEESGFGNCVSLVMCPTCLKMSPSENLQCMFLLMGEGNPVDSEPCSPIIFIVFWGILIACKWQSVVGNGSRPPLIKETCSQLLCSWWMMVQTCQNPVGFTMAQLWLTTVHDLMDLLLTVTVYYSWTPLYGHPLNTDTHI